LGVWHGHYSAMRRPGEGKPPNLTAD
jgi:hypothetical protein